MGISKTVTKSNKSQNQIVTKSNNACTVILIKMLTGGGGPKSEQFYGHHVCKVAHDATYSITQVLPATWRRRRATRGPSRCRACRPRWRTCPTTRRWRTRCFNASPAPLSRNWSNPYEVYHSFCDTDLSIQLHATREHWLRSPDYDNGASTIFWTFLIRCFCYVSSALTYTYFA